MKPLTEKYVTQSADRKMYEYHIPKLSEEKQEQLEALVQKLEAAGATRPLSWAWSETKEGIPQFARFRVLQELYQTACAVPANIDCAHDFDPEMGTLYQEIAAVSGKAALDQLLLNYGRGLLSHLISLLDEGNFESERDGFSWQLMQTNPETDELLAGIHGLHEDFIDFDQEITLPDNKGV